MRNENELSLDFSIVRTLRKRRGLTLEAVSEKSGISIAVLSKLERNQSRAEVETLYRLAKVFGLSGSDLLSLAESRTATCAQQSSYQSGPFQFDRVEFKGVRCFRATARAGTALLNPEAHGDDLEICWVQKGSMSVHLPGEHHQLTSGRALKFDAALPHRYEIEEDSQMVILHLEKPNRF